ncbi:MAG: HEAT repeat domain-containing protein [Planctomycetaceae bacterium]
MHRIFHRRLLASSCVVLALACPCVVSAQPTPAPPPAGLTVADDDAARNDPSPLVGDPKTPEALLEATLLMVDIARPDLAKLYFDRLVEQDPDDATLLELRDRFGAGALLRLAAVKELAGGAAKLIDRSNAASVKRAGDLERIVSLLEKLDGDVEDRATAEAELKGLGVYAVPGLLQVVASEDQAPLHENAIAALVGAGESAVPLLAGALRGAPPTVRAHVATVLGHIRSPAASPYLWYSAISDREAPEVRAAARAALARILKTSEADIDRVAGAGAVARLVKTAREHFRHEVPWADQQDQRVTLWTWSDKARTIVPRQIPPDQASDEIALALARQALALAPERRDVQTLNLNLALTADTRRARAGQAVVTGPDTAYDLALSAGADVMLEALAEALASSRADAAIADLKVLEQIGTAALVYQSCCGKRSPLIAALDFADAGVQFAAASAILQLDPQQPFPGAPRVVEVLKRAAAGGGRAHAVIGEISAERGAQMAGILQDLGFEPLVYGSGRSAFKAATSRSDVGLVVLHPNIIRWPLSETLANLRADSRTAGIPIVIHSPERLLTRMQPYVRNHRQVSLASSTESADDFEFQAEAALHRGRAAALPADQQASQRASALAWFAHLAQGRRTKVFDLSGCEEVLSQALLDSKLAATSLDALGELPSREAQRRIADLALDVQADAALRENAASKLAFHLQRFGLLLPHSTIERLHAAWRDGNEPAAVRTALGGMIGSLKPDAALVGRRLQAFPRGGE